MFLEASWDVGVFSLAGFICSTLWLTFSASSSMNENDIP